MAYLLLTVQVRVIYRLRWFRYGASCFFMKKRRGSPFGELLRSLRLFFYSLFFSIWVMIGRQFSA